MKLGSAEIAIPSETLLKWQRIVDLLASIMQVPSAVLCKLEPPHYTHYRIVAANNSEENPFPVDDTFSMDFGTFCETVIKSREPLLVINALEEDRWKLAPEIKFGMVSYLGFPVVWPDGRMFGTICVLDDKANRYSDLYQQLLLHCRDVLEADLQALVRLGDEVEDQKAYLKELFARVPEAVVMVDRESRITRINPEFTKIFGYTAEEAIGHGIQELIAPDDLREEAEGFLYRMFETGEAFAVETVRRRKNGTRVPVSLICVPVPSHASEKVGYVIYRDMTDAKRLEDEQRRYHAIQLELAHANRIATLGQLSATIAHEVNQPLAAIVTNGEASLRWLTRPEPDVEEVQKLTKYVVADARRASQIIARIRGMASRRGPEKTVLSLDEVIREALLFLRHQIQSLAIVISHVPAVAEPKVLGDRTQLQQVIVNLAVNAMQAIEQAGGASRKIVIRTFCDDASNLRCSLEDSGPGIDLRHIEHLFESFFSTKNEGMGMGLAICRSVIEAHGGRIAADNGSALGGARFSFSLPVAGTTT